MASTYSSSNVDFQNQPIVNISNPTNSQDAATKIYVDKIRVQTITSLTSPSLSDSSTHYNANTNSSAFSIQLPNPSVVGSGFHIYIKDVTGNFGTNNLTLLRFGSEKIENVTANKVLSADFGFWKIYTDGTDWWVG